MKKNIFLCQSSFFVYGKKNVMNVFDTLYYYLIAFDNDRVTLRLQNELFRALYETFPLPRRQYLCQHRQEFYRRETIKNILIFLYENILTEHEDSPYYHDFLKANQSDSFFRLIYIPSKF